MKAPVGVVVALGLVGCGGEAGPRELEIVGAAIDEAGTGLTLTIQGCDPAGLGVTTEETPQTVTVSVTADAVTDEACEFTQVLALAAPLGDRELRDGGSGDAIALTG